MCVVLLRSHWADWPGRPTADLVGMSGNGPMLLETIDGAGVLSFGRLREA